MMALLFLMSWFSIALSAENPIQAALTATWSNLDANKNGNLELSEFTGAMYKSYDVNNDHKVTEREFLTGWNRAYSHQEIAGSNVYTQVDLDGDHFWTDADLTATYKNMDTSGDGLVSKTEFIDFAAKVLKKANFIVVGGVIG